MNYKIELIYNNKKVQTSEVKILSKYISQYRRISQASFALGFPCDNRGWDRFELIGQNKDTNAYTYIQIEETYTDPYWTKEDI